MIIRNLTRTVFLLAVVGFAVLVGRSGWTLVSGPHPTVPDQAAADCSADTRGSSGADMATIRQLGVCAQAAVGKVSEYVHTMESLVLDATSNGPAQEASFTGSVKEAIESVLPANW